MPHVKGTDFVVVHTKRDPENKIDGTLRCLHTHALALARAIDYEIAKDCPKIDKASSEIILVAGDKDFVPVVEDLKAERYNICVAFWDHAAGAMREKASSFFSLNPYLKHLAK